MLPLPVVFNETVRGEPAVATVEYTPLGTVIAVQ